LFCEHSDIRSLIRLFVDFWSYDAKRKWQFVKGLKKYHKKVTAVAHVYLFRTPTTLPAANPLGKYADAEMHYLASSSEQTKPAAPKAKRKRR
jgi:hypothetical protein